jgi:hypothetical protein
LAMVRRHRRMGKQTKRENTVRANTRRPASPKQGRTPTRRAASPWRERFGGGAKARGNGGKAPNPADMTASRRAAGIDLEARLQSVIGLESVKDKVRALKDTLVKRRFRKDVGAPLVDVGPLHMIFTGNPGCGKTSIARLLAKLLFDLGAVPSPVFVEVQRTDLVAGHVGQTGPKTRAKIDEAKGGVLFVDEVYPSVTPCGFELNHRDPHPQHRSKVDPTALALRAPRHFRPCCVSIPPPPTPGISTCQHVGEGFRDGGARGDHDRYDDG